MDGGCRGGDGHRGDLTPPVARQGVSVHTRRAPPRLSLPAGCVNDLRA
ncbi:hypothetical protein B005_1558 [Nocardiopsis alba ATCC BAA-2165]|uniref:Uncharacterized protein n=1 Tax=Nocardiopsis alba (strain ATCC BAA-2165 / BE74) TaxID=1205910 RepID=J7L1L0_NOCAA|nr:hypothetical protein B005_1558 [Nocardiopsis alba ATCC BAA-2165]